jgi:hypothetical protein
MLLILRLLPSNEIFANHRINPFTHCWQAKAAYNRYAVLEVKEEVPAYKTQARSKAMQINLFTNGKTNTQSVMKASISLAVAAMLLTAAFAVPAAAQKQVPFKGSLQGHETDTPEGGPPPTTVIADGSATGIATHVGQLVNSHSAINSR